MGQFDGVASPVTENAGAFSGVASPLNNPHNTIPQEPGFFDRVRQDAIQRNAETQDVTGRQQGPLEHALTSAGFVADVAGEGITSLINDVKNPTPYNPNEKVGLPFGMAEQGRKGAELLGVKDNSDIANSIANSELGKAGIEALHAGIDKWHEFKTYHPRIARDIEGVVNLGLIASPMMKGADALIEGGAKTIGAVAEAAPKVVEGAANIAKKAVPAVDEGLRDTATLARQYDIPLSYDQITASKAVKNAQKVSQELPFSGQAGFREAQLSAWNKQILKTVGIEGDKFTKPIMDEAFTKVGKEFDALGSGKTFNLDPFTQKAAEIESNASMMATNDAKENLQNVYKMVIDNTEKDGTISGEKLGLLRSKINELARKSNSPDTQDLLHDLENALIDTMTAGDDVEKGLLSDAKQKYKNLLAIEPLAAKAKAGNISPSLLNDRVFRVYGREHVRGNAGPISDLAQIGFELLPELGGSDTLQKAVYMGGATGAAITNPVKTAIGLGTNRAIQSGINRNQGLIDKALKIPKK